MRQPDFYRLSSLGLDNRGVVAEIMYSMNIAREEAVDVLIEGMRKGEMSPVFSDPEGYAYRRHYFSERELSVFRAHLIDNP